MAAAGAGLTNGLAWPHLTAMKRPDDKRQDESRRIIKRIQAETEMGLVSRTTRRIENHLSAKDADSQDWAEVWGTRIGRTIGALVVVVAFLWLFQWLIGHS